MHDLDSMHIDEGALLALIDGESVPGDGVREHADSCESCTQKLEELRFDDRRAKAAIGSIDSASPWTEMPESLREAARGAVTPIDIARPGVTWRPGRSVAAAAGLIFVLAAGAYAIPGSPVRPFVDRTFLGSEQGPTDPGPGQVAVDPVDGAIRVVVTGATSGLRMTIRPVTAARASVSARDARFGIEAGEIQVSDVTGDLTIELPASASGTVEVDGVAVARSVAGDITRLPAADDSPAEILVETSG